MPMRQVLEVEAAEQMPVLPTGTTAELAELGARHVTTD
jgi:hypothetical protein